MTKKSKLKQFIKFSDMETWVEENTIDVTHVFMTPNKGYFCIFYKEIDE